MININDITAAIETLLKGNLTGYKIQRNIRRNIDPNLAGDNNGWIGIYKNTINYEPATIGSRPWKAAVKIDIEIQYASFGGDNTLVEKKLGEGEAGILAVLETDRTIGGTVAMITGYDIAYDINEASDEICYQAVTITVEAQTRA